MPSLRRCGKVARVSNEGERIVLEKETVADPGISTDLWKIIYESSPLGIELYDADGVLIGANRTCLEIFGVADVDAVKGFKLFEDPNLNAELKADLRKGRTIKQEISFDFDEVREHKLYPTSKHGTVYLDLAIMPFRSPGAEKNSGYIVHVRDITLRKNAESMLEEQKKFVEEVIDKSAVATFVLDKNHRVVLWNRACEGLTGIASSKMIGSGNHWRPFYKQQRMTLADIIIDDKHEIVPRLYEKSSCSTLIPDGIHGEGWYADLNGKDRYIVFDAAPLYDTRYRLIGAIETLHDMTELRRAEEDLERKTRELMRSNAELEHFAHIASHDLKAPLQSIGGFADMLLDKYEDRLDEKGRSFLLRITEGTVRMERLISDLLTYARVTARAKPFEPVSCTAVLAEVVSNLKSMIDESKATVTIEALPTVKGDAIQLVQLFQNLIANAIKYRGGASPKVRVSAAPIAVQREETAVAGEERAASDDPGAMGKGWLFSVMDNGIGIDSRYFKEIFKIFQRVPMHEKTYQGTGIGLAICDKIVERHGGRIWVESEPGRGSTFYFTIREA